MSSCESSGTSKCNTSTNSGREGSNEGKWIGVAVGALVALLVIVWLLRTLLNRRRREKFLRKLGVRKSPTHTQSPPSFNSSTSRSYGNSSIYFTASEPPPYDEIIIRPSSYYLPSPPNVQLNRIAHHYLPSSPDGTSCVVDNFKFCIPCNGFLPYKIHKYRGSMSTLSISLPPIEEDVETPEPTTPSSNAVMDDNIFTICSQDTNNESHTMTTECTGHISTQ